MNSWFEVNKLTVNNKKTVVVDYSGKKQWAPAIYNRGDSLEVSDHIKFLGFHIDKDLKWSYHIDQVCVKLRRTIFKLRSLKKVFQTPELRVYYFANFEALIRYGIVFWGGAASKDINKIFKLQKYALRVMTERKKSDSCRTVFKDFNILTLASLYILEVVYFIKLNMSSFNNKADHKYYTRNKHLPTSDQHRTAVYETGPHFKGVQFYNALPKELQQINDLNIFKYHVKKFLLEKEFYHVDDFHTKLI